MNVIKPYESYNDVIAKNTRFGTRALETDLSDEIYNQRIESIDWWRILVNIIFEE